MSLKQLKQRIQAISATRKITKAMAMISTAKLNSIQNKVASHKLFLKNIEHVIACLKSESKEQPVFFKPQGNQKIVIALGSDQGLCGSFNSQILKKLSSLDFDQLVIFGKKIKNHVVRDPRIIYIEKNQIVEFFKNAPFISVHVLSYEFFSMSKMNLFVKKILPLSITPCDFNGKIDDISMFERVIINYIDHLWTWINLSSNACEYAFRMQAMDNATRNANEIIKKLSLLHNRTRQAMITQELSEILGGIPMDNF
jgi:F-type H+-transporting ATPase subunit gamma